MAAPYRIGDRVNALYLGPRGTTAGTLQVAKVTPLPTFSSWRIDCAEANALHPVASYIVDATGHDRNGYCSPVRTPSKIGV